MPRIAKRISVSQTNINSAVHLRSVGWLFLKKLLEKERHARKIKGENECSTRGNGREIEDGKFKIKINKGEDGCKTIRHRRKNKRIQCGKK